MEHSPPSEDDFLFQLVKQVPLAFYVELGVTSACLQFFIVLVFGSCIRLFLCG